MKVIDKHKEEDGISLLLLCKCSSNISNFIDFNEIKAWAKKREDIHLIITGNLLCSPDEKSTISKLLKGNNKYIKYRKIKSIIIAACSPKLHEKTFRDIAEERNVNISRIAMANIREQCAWVTKNKEAATKKAIQLIRAALTRVKYSEELTQPTMKILSDILIIGGGIAGIKTALTLSKAGRKVYLVEKDISIGGSIIKSEEIAPNMECAPCLIAPLLSAVRDDPNIEVITNAEVEEVVGFFGNFTVTVRKKARFVEDTCVGCEECFEVCPVSVKNDFHYKLGDRKAVYTLFAGSVPAAAVIDSESCRHFTEVTCEECKSVCPFQSINFEQEDEVLSIKTGSIVLATGLSNYNPSGIENLGYNKLDNVFTSYEFERLSSSNGPTESSIVLKNGEVPESAAVIHCAGSLSENGLAYCSKVCCLNALKAGALLKAQNKEIQIYNIHNDIVLNNPKEFEFLKEQKNMGTSFIHCTDLASIKLEKDNGRIRISGKGFENITVDMAVLSTGLLPPENTGELAARLNIDLDNYNFFIPDHELLHSTGTVLDGIYAAGCAVTPCNIPESVTQGQAVAGDILSKLIPGREIELEIMTSVIDESKCAGCKLCITVCPFKAIIFDKEKMVSVVNEAICRGCGTCTAACPSNASTAKHFSDNEIYAEIGGILHE